MMSAILSSFRSSSSGPKPKVSSRISLTSRCRSLRFKQRILGVAEMFDDSSDLVAKRDGIDLGDPIHVEPVDESHVNVSLEGLVLLLGGVGLVGSALAEVAVLAGVAEQASAASGGGGVAAESYRRGGGAVPAGDGSALPVARDPSVLRAKSSEHEREPPAGFIMENS